MRTKAQRLVRCALFAALLCICSAVSIPVGAVPFSMGLLGVLLLSLCLSPLEAVTSVAVFLSIGFCGVPLFSGGMGGIGVLLSPTGGFLIGYLPTAFVVSLAASRLQGGERVGVWRSFLSCFIGILLCHAFGVLHWMVIGKLSFPAAFVGVSLPFLLLDALKALLASVVAERLRPVL